jgi:cytochrome P450
MGLGGWVGVRAGAPAVSRAGTGGPEIPAGELLFPSMLPANGDDRQFANPGALDITRETGGHLGFGQGIH